MGQRIRATSDVAKRERPRSQPARVHHVVRRWRLERRARDRRDGRDGIARGGRPLPHARFPRDHSASARHGPEPALVPAQRPPCKADGLRRESDRASSRLATGSRMEPCPPHRQGLSPTTHTASEILAKVKSSATNGGAIIPPKSLLATRAGVPKAIVFCNKRTGLSLKRKLTTGEVTLPFSIRNRPSRVSPVHSTLLGFTSRTYNKCLISNPP